MSFKNQSSISTDQQEMKTKDVKEIRVEEFNTVFLKSLPCLRVKNNINRLILSYLKSNISVLIFLGIKVKTISDPVLSKIKTLLLLGGKILSLKL